MPTYQFSLASTAAGGAHAFWEWGTRGTPATEVARMHLLTAALIVAGFHAADGTVVQPPSARWADGRASRSVTGSLDHDPCDFRPGVRHRCRAATSVSARQSGNLRVEFQGPGGHSYGSYGRVSALHAAARAVILIQKALPAGSYQITNLTGGNSVNDRVGRAHRAEADGRKRDGYRRSSPL